MAFKDWFIRAAAVAGLVAVGSYLALVVVSYVPSLPIPGRYELKTYGSRAIRFDTWTGKAWLLHGTVDAPAWRPISR